MTATPSIVARQGLPRSPPSGGGPLQGVLLPKLQTTNAARHDRAPKGASLLRRRGVRDQGRCRRRHHRSAGRRSKIDGTRPKMMTPLTVNTVPITVGTTHAERSSPTATVSCPHPAATKPAYDHVMQYAWVVMTIGDLLPRRRSVSPTAIVIRLTTANT